MKPFRVLIRNATTRAENNLLGQKTAIRIAAWACLFAIVVLSLAPTETVVRTGLGGRVEHVVAYSIATFLTALAYGHRWGVIVSLLTYAGVLEFLQRFSPGRVSSARDYLFSAVGIGLGVAAFVLFRRLAGRHRD